MTISEKYLIPRQAEETGVMVGQHLEISRDALRQIIRNYTREAGLRNLEREISKVCRKHARQLVEGKNELIRIKGENLPEFLGAPRFITDEELDERIAVPGVAIGLAWTPAGGDR